MTKKPGFFLLSKNVISVFPVTETGFLGFVNRCCKVAEILQGADLTGASLKNTLLVDADLQGARLEASNLERTDLRNANLSHANLVKALRLDNIQNSRSVTLCETILPDGITSNRDCEVSFNK